MSPRRDTGDSARSGEAPSEPGAARGPVGAVAPERGGRDEATGEPGLVARAEPDLAALDLRQLRHFLAVVEHGHYGRAAQQLGISKQGISQSVAALEHVLGVRLFERGQWGAVPTEFGRTLAPHARLISAEARKARSELESLREQHRGEVTFALGSAFSEYVGPRAISRFRAAHPRVVLKVANVHPDSMLTLLAQGELDFVAMGDLRGTTPEGVERVPLFRMANHVLMAAGHPLAARARPEIRDFVDATFVGVWRHDLAGRTIAGAFEQHGLPAPRVIDCDNVLVTRGLVLDEGCLVIANRLFFERELRARLVVERPVAELSYEVTYALYHRRGTILGRATRALMDEIRAVALDRFGAHALPPVA